MARRVRIPQELRTRPFTVDDARRAGLQRWNLEATTWVHVGAGVYAWSGLPQTPWLVLSGLQLRIPEAGAFSGRTAAWIHGLEVPPLEPVQVTIPDAIGFPPTRTVAYRRAHLRPDDIVERRGLRVTSVPRTLLDLSARLSLVDAVVVTDSALRLKLVTVPQLHEWTASRRGVKGVVPLRRALDLARPGSGSPMETRLRLLLVLSGLPEPLLQTELTDRGGRFVGRVDLYYPAQRLAIEYDGGVHRDMLVEDNRRQNDILAAGYRLLRFTASDLLGAPDSLVARVRAALTGRPSRDSAA